MDPSTLRELEPVARTACRLGAPHLRACQVEELVQDALLVAWARRAAFDPAKGDLGRWVRGICRNLCRDAVRRRGDVLTRDGILEATSPERSALTELRAEERRRVVMAAIDALPEDERELLRLRYLHELPRKAIAALLGASDDAVRVQLQTASRRLRRVLKERLAELGSSFLRSESGAA